MPQDIKESDWKQFKKVQEIAQDRFWKKRFAELKAIANDENKATPDRYAEIASLMRDTDKELRAVFNDFRRSTATLQLAGFVARNLLTEEELSAFSPEIRDRIALIVGLRD